MRKFFSKLIHFHSEPHSMTCPRCKGNVGMTWSGSQGPIGGWKCPKCGLQIDYK